MIYRIEFSKDAQKVIKKWKKSNLPLFKKLEKLIPELSEHPRTGKGHPEPLKGGNDITYSRHITAQDRIIYDILDEEILVSIIELEGHYNDKYRVHISVESVAYRMYNNKKIRYIRNRKERYNIVRL